MNDITKASTLRHTNTAIFYLPRTAALANVPGMGPPSPHRERFRAPIIINWMREQWAGSMGTTTGHSMRLTQRLATRNFKRDGGAHKIIVVEKQVGYVQVENMLVDA